MNKIKPQYRQEALRFIRAYMCENSGHSPTFDQIALAIGGRSKSTVSQILNELQAEGSIIVSRPANRSVLIFLPDGKYTTENL